MRYRYLQASSAARPEEIANSEGLGIAAHLFAILIADQ